MTSEQQYDIPFAMMNGYLKLTVTEITPEGVTQTLSVTDHPWTLRILGNRYWRLPLLIGQRHIRGKSSLEKSRDTRPVANFQRYQPGRVSPKSRQERSSTST